MFIRINMKLTEQLLNPITNHNRKLANFSRATIRLIRVFMKTPSSQKGCPGKPYKINQFLTDQAEIEPLSWVALRSIEIRWWQTGLIDKLAQLITNSFTH